MPKLCSATSSRAPRKRNAAGVGTLTASKPAAAFLAAVFDLSPFCAIALRRPQILDPLFEMPLSKRLKR